MKQSIAKLCVAALFVCGACSKKEAPPADSQPAAPVASPAPAPAAPPAPEATASAAVNDENVPTEEQFEDEAAEKVTSTTLDAQLDALEKEIKAD